MDGEREREVEGLCCPRMKRKRCQKEKGPCQKGSQIRDTIANVRN